jgi:DHA1 family tetracycline resistance protein-like MFS transporter
MSVLVQGFLLGKLLKRYSPQRLAVVGLVSSTLAYASWGAASEGWMMFAVIFLNVAGYTVTASIQSIISSAADAHNQGQTLGAVSSLNSLMAVIAPLVSAPLLIMVSHFPQGDWRIGAPLYFSAVLQGAALVLAVLHFRSQRRGQVADDQLLATPARLSTSMAPKSPAVWSKDCSGRLQRHAALGIARRAPVRRTTVKD